MKRKSDANAGKQVWSKPTVKLAAPVRRTKGGANADIFEALPAYRLS